MAKLYTECPGYGILNLTAAAIHRKNILGSRQRFIGRKDGTERSEI
jgi:hypothetical protein